MARVSMKPGLKADKETARQSTVGTSHKELPMLQTCFSSLSLAVQSYTVAVEKEVNDQPGAKTFPAEVLGSCMQWGWC